MKLETAECITNRYASMRVEVKIQKPVLWKNGSVYSYRSAIEPSRQQSAKRCTQAGDSVADNKIENLTRIINCPTRTLKRLYMNDLSVKKLQEVISSWKTKR